MSRKRNFAPPSVDFYRLSRLARDMSLLSPQAQRIKAKEYFSQALRFLGKDDSSTTIGGAPR